MQVLETMNPQLSGGRAHCIIRDRNLLVGIFYEKTE
jgi:hypothetical protein